MNICVQLAAASGCGTYEEEAEKAIRAELSQHWVQGPDGSWTTNTETRPLYMEMYGPVLLQLRKRPEFVVESVALSDADRRNGVAWVGKAVFLMASAREAGNKGEAFGGRRGAIYRQHGQWTQWVDIEPEPLYVGKVKGQWKFEQSEIGVPVCKWLGTRPTAADFARVGVSQ